MKSISNFLYEAATNNTVDNIILANCGSMQSGGKEIANTLQKVFKNAKFYIYDGDKDQVIPLNAIEDYQPGGERWRAQVAE